MPDGKDRGFLDNTASPPAHTSQVAQAGVKIA